MHQPGNDVVFGEAIKAPYSAGTRTPDTPLPRGAVDCHHHIFDDRFLQPNGQRIPIQANCSDYRRFKRRLGLERSVVVAPSPYDTDNSCLLDAIASLGPENTRGVAMVEPDVAAAELDRLAAAGVRGMRVYLAKNRVPSGVELASLGARAADRGWTLQLVGGHDKEVLVDWEEAIAALPCPVVIDHLGWAPQPAGLASATAQMILRLVALGHVYAKLSGLYLSSASGPPDYADVDVFAAHLCQVAPERLLWGTDWPHAGALKQPPDGALLVDKLEEWTPNAQTRHRILVENPHRLYW